jgi:glycosyltransferase involved in cell wall biosynthesis
VLEYLLQSPVAREVIAGVITPSSSPVFETAKMVDLPVWDWPITNDSLASALRALPPLLRTFRPAEGVSILHAWHTRGFEISGLLGRFWKLSTSGTLHDHPRLRHSRQRQWLIRLAANRLDRLAVVSHALERVCSGEDWSVPMETVPNGLPEIPASSPRPATQQLRIGFLGLNASWKGISLLAEVVARTSALPLCWKLYGAPSSDSAPILAKMLQHAEGRVSHLGYCSPRDIFASIDVLFHPSIGFDPYPTALLEAARAGVPAVASDVGGSSEIVRHLETGILFSEGNVEEAISALQKYCATPGSMRTMGAAARARFEKEFSLEAMAGRYIRFWR